MAGLDVIAITDHNMTENNIYAQKCAEDLGIDVLFGMEVQTMEEIHVLAIFDDRETALGFQEYIYDLLPDVDNDIDFFGDQVVVDENDEIVRFEHRLLLNSAAITLEDATWWIKNRGGLAIPSHIDSPTFSVISQLGFVPADLPFDALEVRDITKIPDLQPLIPRTDVPFVTFSDAHYPGDIGRRKTVLTMDRPTCREAERALKALSGSEPVVHSL